MTAHDGFTLHEVKDLTWFRGDGHEMTTDDWNNPITRCIGLRLAGDAIPEVDARGRRTVDDTLLVILNAHHELMPFILPAHKKDVRWVPVVDTRETSGRARGRPLRGG